MIAVAAVASHRTARIFTEAPAINQSDMALSKRPCSSAETDEKASQKQDTSINSGTAMDNTSHSYSTSEAARLETDRGRLAMDRSSVASLTRPGLPANLPHLNLEHLQALEQAKVVPPASPSPVASEASTLEEIETPFGQPINFGCVVPGVYRSSFPRTEQAYEYLKGLNLKTIV